MYPIPAHSVVPLALEYAKRATIDVRCIRNGGKRSGLCLRGNGGCNMLNKSISSGKEHRKPYFGSKAIDATCRNHGSCDYCKMNRLQVSGQIHEV